MTEQQEKAKFKQAIDHTLSDIQGDAFLAQRVLARAKKGAKPVKYHIPKGVVIALIALLCMGTVAVAAGLYGGSINFEGEITYNDSPSGPMPTVAPRPTDAVSIEAERDEEAYAEALFVAENYAYEEALSTETLYMLYELKADGTRRPQTQSDMRIETASQAEFEAMMAEAPWLPRPNYIPEGFAFADAEVFYDCHAGGEWKLLESEIIDGMFEVEWYQPTDRAATHYFLNLRSESDEKQYIRIFVRMSTAYDGGYSFGFGEGMAASAVEVPGMENAIVITSEQIMHLDMRRCVEEPINILWFSEDGDHHMRYEDVFVDVTAPKMDVNDLIRMFANE